MTVPSPFGGGRREVESSHEHAKLVGRRLQAPLHIGLIAMHMAFTVSAQLLAGIDRIGYGRKSTSH